MGRTSCHRVCGTQGRGLNFSLNSQGCYWRVSSMGLTCSFTHMGLCILTGALPSRLLPTPHTYIQRTPIAVTSSACTQWNNRVRIRLNTCIDCGCQWTPGTTHRPHLCSAGQGMKANETRADSETKLTRRVQKGHPQNLHFL